MDIDTGYDSLESFEGSIPSDLVMNTAYDSGVLEMLGYAIVGLNLLSVVFYVLFAWGLYTINKKLGEKHAWMSWVPILQMYSLSTAAGKSLMKYIVWPIIFVIIALIAMGVLAASLGDVGGVVGGLLLLVSYIYTIVRAVQLYHGISLRTGRGAWTTVGFIFISFIMFPIVGYKLKGNNSSEEKL